jgi:hypothetical protein
MYAAYVSCIYVRMYAFLYDAQWRRWHHTYDRGAICYVNFSARRSFLVHSGMLYRFITVKGWVQSRESPHGICVEKSGMGTDCSASTLAFQGQLFHP